MIRMYTTRSLSPNFDLLPRPCGVVSSTITPCSALGFAEAIDDHLAEIIDGIEVEDLPSHETALLRDLGIADPETYLSGMVYVVRARKEDLKASAKETPVSRQLESVPEKLAKGTRELGEGDSGETDSGTRRRPQRRWFKGLSKIGLGAFFSIVDIASLYGLVTIPVPTGAEVGGAMASVAMGVTKMMDGIGDLRNE